MIGCCAKDFDRRKASGEYSENDPDSYRERKA